jgi:hypothetical protein
MGGESESVVAMVSRCCFRLNWRDSSSGHYFMCAGNGSITTVKSRGVTECASYSLQRSYYMLVTVKTPRMSRTVKTMSE